LTGCPWTLAATSLFRLSLDDTRRRAPVQIDSAVTKVGAQSDYVWWATGDNETLTWHALDGRTLH
jgi:membrane-bound inhibitor of C-type lysozyme